MVYNFRVTNRSHSPLARWRATTGGSPSATRTELHTASGPERSEEGALRTAIKIVTGTTTRGPHELGVP